MNGQDEFVKATGRAAVAGGVLGVASMVAVFVIEARSTDQMMTGSGATFAGWASFVAASLLAVGLLGVAVRFAGVLSTAGRVALGVLGFATAITVGAASTLALVVPTLVDRVPDLMTDPPAVIPATFIGSGLVSGIAALVLAGALRKAGHRGLGLTLLFAGAVVTIVPLPSRFFLLALAVGVLLLADRPARVEQREPAYAA